jgi:hypothetical protein
LAADRIARRQQRASGFTHCAPAFGPAHGDTKRSEPAAEEWLMIAWLHGDAEHDHYWLLTPPADIPFEPIVDLTKQRWRDYLELKQEVGLGHYKRRGWRRYKHHSSLCVAVYRLLLSEKEKIPLRTCSRWMRHAIYRSRRIPPPAALPRRLQQHVPNSITTLRIRLARSLPNALPCCPCFGRSRLRRLRQE